MYGLDSLRLFRRQRLSRICQDLSLPAPRRGSDPAQSGMEHRLNLHPPAARICVPGDRESIGIHAKYWHGSYRIRWIAHSVWTVWSKRYRSTASGDIQGCQFTSEAFTGVLEAHGIAISMDGRGRALDNIFVERLWRSERHPAVIAAGTGGIFCVLQHGKNAPIAGLQHTGCGLPERRWWRSQHCR